MVNIIKLGDSFYLNVPKALFEYFNLNIEDEYDIEIKDNKITYTKSKEKQTKLSDFKK